MKQGVTLAIFRYACPMSRPPSSKPPSLTVIKNADGRRKPRPGPEEQARTIVNAAVALFLEHGVRSVSIMQICDRADVSRSTFYRSFDGMDALLQHIYQVSVFAPVELFMQANLAQPAISPEQLKQTLDEMYEAIFAQGDYAELVFREANDPNSPAFAVVNAAFDQIVKALQKNLPPVSGSGNKKVDAIFLKSLLNANQWIAHDTIRKGLTPANKQAAREAAWQLVKNALNL